MNFKQEHSNFLILKNNVTLGILEQYNTAIKNLHSKYNTTIYENRFIVGGAVKVFTEALIRSVGISLHQKSITEGDIILHSQERLLVKGHFTGGTGVVRLVNTMGDGIDSAEWDIATLFIVSDIGIIYGDPTKVNPIHVQKKKDAITLNYKALQELASDENNLIKTKIPSKLPQKMISSSHKASVAVANQILLGNKLRKYCIVEK